ncbi:methyltransferase [Tautonia sociabilis]|uniref:Methyltransferase domain-containing protein n=1 Tax=Tautonia sociabilis TaxID=2080755 RepID=A0A432MM36_9BACT|nr:methyltransferase [Tautonia sociabilis]RUL88481.1 methyltransferase domain-containing protein [Tautonia sociabilis]
MSRHELHRPSTDPTPIFELFRGNFATELLTAAVAHFDVFGRLSRGPMAADDLRLALKLAERPAVVLFTALRAMGLLCRDDQGRLSLTELAREHLVPGGPFDVGGYIGLAARSPGVREMVDRLRSNHPNPSGSATEEGVAFVYREGLDSAMERESSARSLTLSLAGRARNVAPILAETYPLPECRTLLDVGGGSGLYSIAYLQRHPDLTAIVWDRPEVLKVALELAEELGVADRLECRSGDMFTDPVPHGSDVVLLSNILHDWDVPECRTLLSRLAEALSPGRRLLIHDVFLNDEMDGPLPIALYSASLFSLTEGRAYSAAEYREMLTDAGFEPGEVVPTLVHCGVLPAVRSS